MRFITSKLKNVFRQRSTGVWWQRWTRSKSGCRSRTTIASASWPSARRTWARRCAPPCTSRCRNSRRIRKSLRRLRPSIIYRCAAPGASTPRPRVASTISPTSAALASPSTRLWRRWTTASPSSSSSRPASKSRLSYSLTLLHRRSRSDATMYYVTSCWNLCL